MPDIYGGDVGFPVKRHLRNVNPSRISSQYSVTKQLVPKVVLTSKQRLRFSTIWSIY